METRIDPNEPDQIRDLAKRHWAAINKALASDGNLEAAFAPQLEFLEKYLPTLPPGVSKRVFEIYAGESAQYAAGMSRIGDIKHQAAMAEIKRKSQNTQYIYLGLFVIGLLVLARLVAA